MRWVVRAGAALLALALLAVGVLLWALPRLASSDAAKARIQEIVRRSVGRELQYAKLDFALFPPSLEVAEPEISGDDGDEPLARAERVALRVELWPLLRRELQVSSLRLDGLALHLVRTEQGFALPRPAPRGGGEPEGAGGAAGGDAPPDDDDEDGIAFGIERIAVRDAAIAVDDRSQRPAVAWRATGVDLDLRGGAAGEPIALEGALAAASGPALESEGPVRFEAELSGGPAAATGPFRVDASDARVHWGASVRKPAGTRAVVRGQLVRDADGNAGIDALEIALRDLVAHGQLRTAPRTQLRLRAGAVKLAGWDEVVPVLGFAPLSGTVAAPELALATGPTELRGRLDLDGVVVAPPGRPPVAIDGDVELLGTELRTRDLVVRAADQPLAVTAQVTSLFDGPRYEVRFETAGADVDALLGAFAGQSGRLEGPLDAKGVLRGPLGGGSFADAISGSLEFDIEGGKIVGAPLLQAVLGPLGARLAEAGRARGGELERFYGETFEMLKGSVQVEDGRLLTRPLTLRHRDYTAELRGPIALADLSLDLRGSLTLFESVDAALARALGAPESYVPVQRTLELAAVKGTLGAPKVQLAGNGVAGLAASYAGAFGREALQREIEKLGGGSGDPVEQGVRILEGLLGGRRRAPAETPPAEAPPAEDAPPASEAPEPGPDAAGEAAPEGADPDAAPAPEGAEPGDAPPP